jgi:hypothetical protein
VDPSLIRAPFVRRDRVAAGQDYVQFFIDPLGTRRFAQVFRVNVQGVQTDGLVNEATGTEDDAPDFPFDVATRRTAEGWQAELRIPWSSLRYRPASSEPWAIMAYRGWPRADNTQIASGPVARSATCFMCFATTVKGFETPQRRGSLRATPSLVLRADSSDAELDAGLDIKWRPTGSVVIDLTANPDFSELEADAPQITGNVRYAASVLEKRPFFLESADMLETPLQFLYTRSIANPSLGARLTRRGEQLELTTWALRDDAGGRVLLPGPFSAGTRVLGQQTDVTFGRMRANRGRFSAAIEWSDRRGDGYHNTVAGADLAWLPTDSDRLSAQWLFSDTRDPLALGTSDGASGAAWKLEWQRTSERLDLEVYHQRIDREFRADAGFMPTADIDEQFAKIGVRFFDVGFLNELRPYIGWLNQSALEGEALIERGMYPAVYFQGPRNFYGFVELHLRDRARAFAQAPVAEPRFVRLDVAITPLPSWPRLRVYGDVGRLLDYGSGLLRDGYELTTSVLLRPVQHLELEAGLGRLRLDDREGGASVVREDNATLTAIYHFSAALNCRVQWIDEHSERSSPVTSSHSSTTTTLVISYRPDWRTTAFIGISHLPRDEVLAESANRVFLKVSHSFGT